MTGLYEGLGGRPEPVVLPGADLVVPGAAAAELAGALELLAAFVRGTPPPAARLSKTVLGIKVAAGDAAVLYRRQATQRAITSAAPTVRAVAVLPPAQPEGSSTQMVTTATAAAAVGVSPEWVRRLAVDGKVRAELGPRRTWQVDLDDLRAWSATRKRKGIRHAGTADIAGAPRRGAA